MAAEAKSHVVLTIQAVLQSTTEDPDGFMGSFLHMIESDQASIYSRPLNLTEDPMPLDVGWLEDNAGLIGLVYPKIKYPIVPKPEQLLEDQKKVIAVTFKDSDENWIVPPGMPFFGFPSDHGQVLLSCLYGSAKAKLYVFPK